VSEHSLLTRLSRWLQRIETGLLVTLVAALVFFAALQIVLRQFFETSLQWADPLMRNLVLWTAMLGAMAAAQDDKHLRVDALERLVSGVKLRIVRFATRGFAAAIAFIFAWQSARFVGFEREDGQIAFLGVARWMCELIMPFGFSVIGLRFAIAALVTPPQEPVLPVGVPPESK
jgi:TRAP-type C4-dicarboxylate transport system permease small subunit